MEKQQSFFFFKVLVSLGCVLVMTSCGKKGNPEAPEGSYYSYPGGYPPEE